MRRYAHALRRIVTSLVGETRKAAQEGVYLIKRAAGGGVSSHDDGRQIMTTAPIFKPPQRPSAHHLSGSDAPTTDAYTMVDGGRL
jgi:hypothetical protein